MIPNDIPEQTNERASDKQAGSSSVPEMPDGSKWLADFDETAAYNAEVASKVEALAEVCRKHNLPMILSVAYKVDSDGVMQAAACTTRDGRMATYQTIAWEPIRPEADSPIPFEIRTLAALEKFGRLKINVRPG